MLVMPPVADVDYRAACFCHQKLISYGYICSVCLSVFCSFTPICSTCECNFEFDINMLKKARLKLTNQQMYQQQKQISFTASITDTASNLATKFQDTSIQSPAIQFNSDQLESSSDIPISINSESPAIQPKIIRLAENQRKAVKSINPDDSFDMLE
jgi:hypothetical protein